MDFIIGTWVYGPPKIMFALLHQTARDFFPTSDPHILAGKQNTTHRCWFKEDEKLVRMIERKWIDDAESLLILSFDDQCKIGTKGEAIFGRNFKRMRTIKPWRRADLTNDKKSCLAQKVTGS